MSEVFGFLGSKFQENPTITLSILGGIGAGIALGLYGYNEFHDSSVFKRGLADRVEACADAPPKVQLGSCGPKLILDFDPLSYIVYVSNTTDEGPIETNTASDETDTSAATTDTATTENPVPTMAMDEAKFRADLDSSMPEIVKSFNSTSRGGYAVTGALGGAVLGAGLGVYLNRRRQSGVDPK